MLPISGSDHSDRWGLLVYQGLYHGSEGEASSITACKLLTCGETPINVSRTCSKLLVREYYAGKFLIGEDNTRKFVIDKIGRWRYGVQQGRK